MNKLRQKNLVVEEITLSAIQIPGGSPAVTVGDGLGEKERNTSPP